MRLTTAIRFALARLLLKAAALPVAPAWLKTTFFEPTFRALTREAYKKNAAVFACISALAFAYPEPPLLVYQNEDDDADAIPGHPIRQLLKQPNPRMGEKRFNVVVMTYIALGGVCYLHKVRDGGQRVVQLWPYHIGQMLPVPGGPAWLERYDFDDGTGTLRPIPVDDVIPLTWPDVDPEQPWTAMPPLAAAAGDVDQANEIRRYVFTLLKNDAVPRGVLEMPVESALSTPEVRRMKEQWHERYGGDARGDIAILEGGARYTRIGLNIQELAASALFDIPEAHICAVLRVPPIIAHLNVGLQRSTFANYGEARQAFTQDTMAPIWAITGDEVQAGLASEFGPSSGSGQAGVDLRHDLSKVQALQEQATEKWGRVDAAYNSGYLSFQEARVALGYGDPTPDDMFIMPTVGLERARTLLNPQPPPTIRVLPPAAPPLLPGPTDQQPPNADGQESQPPPPKARTWSQTKVGVTAAQRASAQRTARKLQRVRMQTAKRMESAVDSFFRDLADQVASRIGKAWRPAIRRKDLPGEDELLLADDWDVLTTLVKRYTIEVIEASWPAWNGALNVDVAFSLTDPAVVAVLKTAGKRVADITETTRGFLAQALADGADAGMTIDELVPGIQMVIEESYKGRARAIARTELGTAQQNCAVARYFKAGVERVVVFDNGQDDPDEACAAVNNTVQTLDWARKNTLQHPNCTRCFAPYFE